MTFLLLLYYCLCYGGEQCWCALNHVKIYILIILIYILIIFLAEKFSYKLQFVIGFYIICMFFINVFQLNDIIRQVYVIQVTKCLFD
jgi:hypothetical protein